MPDQSGRTTSRSTNLYGGGQPDKPAHGHRYCEACGRQRASRYLRKRDGGYWMCESAAYCQRTVLKQRKELREALPCYCDCGLSLQDCQHGPDVRPINGMPDA